MLLHEAGIKAKVPKASKLQSHIRTKHSVANLGYLPLFIFLSYADNKEIPVPLMVPVHRSHVYNKQPNWQLLHTEGGLTV